jgi:hypothetical protein
MRHRPLQTLALLPPMAAGLVLMAPLGLTDGLIAGAALAQTQPRGQAQGKGAEPDTRSFIGAWALTDNRNNLFNVRLFPGGRAVSTVGAEGVPAAGASRLSPNEMRELGRWQPWGNGVRIDYGDGWTDWIYVGPDGLSHAAWQPGQSRGSVPFNFGPAVKLSGVEAQVVGVYSFPPAQAELKPYTATLLSNGQAFNDNCATGLRAPTATAPKPGACGRASASSESGEYRPLMTCHQWQGQTINPLPSCAPGPPPRSAARR